MKKLLSVLFLLAVPLLSGCSISFMGGDPPPGAALSADQMFRADVRDGDFELWDSQVGLTLPTDDENRVGLAEFDPTIRFELGTERSALWKPVADNSDGRLVDLALDTSLRLNDFDPWGEAGRTFGPWGPDAVSADDIRCAYHDEDVRTQAIVDFEGPGGMSFWQTCDMLDRLNQIEHPSQLLAFVADTGFTRADFIDVDVALNQAANVDGDWCVRERCLREAIAFEAELEQLFLAFRGQTEPEAAVFGP